MPIWAVRSHSMSRYDLFMWSVREFISPLEQSQGLFYWIFPVNLILRSKCLIIFSICHYMIYQQSDPPPKRASGKIGQRTLLFKSLQPCLLLITCQPLVVVGLVPNSTSSRTHSSLYTRHVFFCFLWATLDRYSISYTPFAQSENAGKTLLDVIYNNADLKFSFHF